MSIILFREIDPAGAPGPAWPRAVVAYLALYAARVDPVATGTAALLQELVEDRLTKSREIDRLSTTFPVASRTPASEPAADPGMKSHTSSRGGLPLRRGEPFRLASPASREKAPTYSGPEVRQVRTASSPLLCDLWTRNASRGYRRRTSRPCSTECLPAEGGMFAAQDSRMPEPVDVRGPPVRQPKSADKER
jgi:hypothetical protein